MKLIIDIPEDSYKATRNGCMLPPDVENVVQGIKNGIPLPDGAEILTKGAYSDLCTRAADVPDTNVGDLISRKAAIDAFHFWFRMGSMKISGGTALMYWQQSKVYPVYIQNINGKHVSNARCRMDARK